MSLLVLDLFVASVLTLVLYSSSISASKLNSRPRSISFLFTLAIFLITSLALANYFLLYRYRGLSGRYIVTHIKLINASTNAIQLLTKQSFVMNQN